MSKTTFKKRTGTAEIFGHLYETKLLSLLYFRAIHDDRITEFQLASNLDAVGTFDDICFKAIVSVDGFSKPVSVFIQAKHKKNKNRTLKIDLTTYFISYLKIRHRFAPNNEDLFFGGKFDERECLFVVYTTARDEFSNDTKVDSGFCSILNDLIGTGDTAKQPYKQAQDAEFTKQLQLLTTTAFKYQITSLAAQLATFIMSKVDFQQILSEVNENMLRYHVILARKVFEVSEIQPKGHRIATFRHDFFDTNEEYLILFREKLYKEILKLKEKPTDIENLLSSFIAEPNDAKRLSKLIGTVITHKNGLLEINKECTESINHFGPLLNQEIDRSTINEAVELAAKEILLSPEFKLIVPAAFGNKDTTVSKKRRIKFLTKNMTSLIEKFKPSKMITIDDSDDDFDKGFLLLKGGIAGAIGNIFVLDENTKLMKITDNEDALGTNARKLYESWNKNIPNLSEYQFCFKVKKFPKIVLEFNEHEVSLARDFLRNVVFFTGQADENEVEVKLKNEIEQILEYSVYIKAKTDALFLKYHNVIQTWWMRPEEAEYLTKSNQIFERSTGYIIEDPLMISISVPFVRKIKQYNYTFTEDAVRSLNLQDQHSSTVIVAENSVLTIVKVMQHLKNRDHVVLDLEDILNLPTEERNTLRTELIHTNKAKVLILVCNRIQETRIEKITFDNVAKAVRDKRTIIITNDSSLLSLQTYFATTDENIVHDERNSLSDMSEESQMNILESARVKFQDIEVGLKHLVSDWPQRYTVSRWGHEEEGSLTSRQRSGRPQLIKEAQQHEYESSGFIPTRRFAELFDTYLTEKHKQERLRFAREYLDFNWDTTIFSDEKTQIKPKRETSFMA